MSVPPNHDGGLFAPVAMTDEQRMQAVRAFVDVLAVEATEGGPEVLWKLLGYDVEDVHTDEETLNEWCEDVATLLRDVNEAMGVHFEIPKPVEEDDA